MKKKILERIRNMSDQQKRVFCKNTKSVEDLKYMLDRYAFTVTFLSFCNPLITKVDSWKTHFMIFCMLYDMSDKMPLKLAIPKEEILKIYITTDSAVIKNNLKFLLSDEDG